MRILLRGFFKKNLGDDLMVKVICERYPEVDFEILQTKDNFVTHFRKWANVQIGKPNFVRKGYNKIIRALFFRYKFDGKLPFCPMVGEMNYKKYDAVVEVGGSVFMEKAVWGQGPFFVAQRRGTEIRRAKKFFFIGVNFGPYETKGFFTIHQKIFAAVTDICFRDRHSYRLFASLNHVRFAYDSVLNLTYFPCKQEKKGPVLISMIDLDSKDGGDLAVYRRDYEDLMVRVTKQLLREGERVLLFSFCEVQGDGHAMQRVLAMLCDEEREQVSIACYDGDIETALDQIGNAKAIIATRYHAMILALRYRIPFFAVVYDKKTKYTLDDLGICEYVNIEDSATVEATYVLRNIKCYTSVAPILASAEGQYAAFDDFVREKNA